MTRTDSQPCGSSSAWRPVWTVRVGQLRVPVIASLRREIEQIVDRRQQVDAALLDIVRHPGVGGIRVPQRAVPVSSEDRNG